MSTNSSTTSQKSSNISLEDWTDHINTSLDVMYKDLCDFEQSMIAQNENNEEGEVQLMELLEDINEIQRTARSIRPITGTLKHKQALMREQIALLQNSLELLQLEKMTRSVDIMEEAME